VKNAGSGAQERDEFIGGEGVRERRISEVMGITIDGDAGGRGALRGGL
jgi:hypothetical protein